jgi:hypothetical protein
VKLAIPSLKPASNPFLSIKESRYRMACLQSPQVAIAKREQKKKPVATDTGTINRSHHGFISLLLLGKWAGDLSVACPDIHLAMPPAI